MLAGRSQGWSAKRRACVRGTRMPVDATVDNFVYGVSAVEIAEQFEIPAEQVEAILTYAKSHRIAHSV